MVTCCHNTAMCPDPTTPGTVCSRTHPLNFTSTSFRTAAGGIEDGAITLAPCVDFVDQWVTVSEQEIADAIVSLLHHHSKLVEGAAGCAVAAVRKLAGRLAGKRVAVVCCGGNIALPVLKHVMDVGTVS